MKNLFKCETIAQFKINQWLLEQGIEQDDIARAELSAQNQVRITNPAGQYMDIIWQNDHAEII